MSLIASAVVPLLLLCWNAGRLRRSPWPAAAVLLWFGSALLRDAVRNVRAPREWDYACFWLYGHVAAAHRNIYDPAAYAGLTTPFALDADFRRTVLDVGFPYPPPTIALFWPLGYIDNPHVGLAVWYGVQFAALAGAAWVLGRTFWPQDGWRAGVLAAAIVTVLPAATMNVGDAQTNFLVLLVISLALRFDGTPGGAVWTALAFWIKPYAGLLLLFEAVRRRWNRLLIAGVTLAVTLAASAVALGPAVLAAYVRANPAGREPAPAFVEVINQSLLAVALRLHAVLPDHVSALHEPLYLTGALLLTAATVVLCARSSAPSEVGFASMLLLGLIVYPGTLSSYAVALALPMFVLWRHRAAFAGGTAGVAVVTALAVLLGSGPLQRGFEANLLMWAACLYLLMVRRTVPQERPAAVRLPATAGAAR